MTKDAALKLALEALKYPINQSHENFNVDMAELLAHRAITAIKEALAQPEHGWTPERIAGMARLKDAQDKRLAQPEQEPVGQLLENAFGRGQVMWFNKPKDESMLYTTPPQRTWVGLTDEELPPLVGDNGKYMELQQVKRFYKYIEAKLKEQNNA